MDGSFSFSPFVPPLSHVFAHLDDSSSHNAGHMITGTARPFTRLAPPPLRHSSPHSLPLAPSLPRSSLRRRRFEKRKKESKGAEPSPVGCLLKLYTD